MDGIGLGRLRGARHNRAVPGLTRPPSGFAMVGLRLETAYLGERQGAVSSRQPEFVGIVLT